MKVLIIEHTCSEFISSRLPLGRFLKQQGVEVCALVPDNGKAEQYEAITKAGLRLLKYPYKRNDTNLFRNIQRIFFFRKLFKEGQFDIIHSFKFQPNFYAALGSIGLRQTKLVLHITGLGIAFSEKTNLRISLLRFISQCIFLLNALVANTLIFQNHEDQKELWLSDKFQYKSKVIEGSGVDIQKFDKRNFDVSSLKLKQNLEGKFIMTFISRLVWQKGVKEVVQAVKELIAKYPNFYLQIVGDRDAKNPEAVTKEFIDNNIGSNNIQFLGRRSDIPELLAISDLYVYPSYYREGLPRTGLEALATGVPIVTTNSVGCNLLVDHGKNGYLVPPKSVPALKEAIEKLYRTSNLLDFGQNSRQLAERKYQNKVIYNQIYLAYLNL